MKFNMKKLITLLLTIPLASCTPQYDLEKDYCGGTIMEMEKNTFNSGYEFTVLLDSTYRKINLPLYYVMRYELGDKLCEETRVQKIERKIKETYKMLEEIKVN